MDVIKILIVEDESLVAMDMSDMLSKMGYEVLAAAYTYEEAVQLMTEQKPDIVLLDVNLGGSKTGIDLAQLIRSKYQIPFIFITSHSDRATVSKAASMQPNGYIVKPFSEEDLFASLEVALASTTKEKPVLQSTGALVSDSLFVKTDTHFVKVNISEIVWLESDHNYLYIVSEKNKHIVRSNFRDFMTNLPADVFMQIHKSYVINLKRIDSFSHTEVVMNGTSIPLSRNYKDELFDRIKRVQ